MNKDEIKVGDRVNLMRPDTNGFGVRVYTVEEISEMYGKVEYKLKGRSGWWVMPALRKVAP